MSHYLTVDDLTEYELTAGPIATLNSNTEMLRSIDALSSPERLYPTVYVDMDIWVVTLTENELWGRVSMAITCRLARCEREASAVRIHRLVKREAVHRQSVKAGNLFLSTPSYLTTVWNL